MELIKEITIPEKTSLIFFHSGPAMYKFAYDYVQKYRKEALDEFWKVTEKAAEVVITEHFFVREHLWCVYVAGFSASVIAKKLPALLLAHGIEDEDTNYLEYDPDLPLETVFKVFGNVNKANSVRRLRALIKEITWPEFYATRVKDRDPKQLSGLPGIGDILACHLARNLGNKNLVKPDIHLQRLSNKYGYKNPLEMVKSLSDEPPGKVDLILWLASVDNGTL